MMVLASFFGCLFLGLVVYLYAMAVVLPLSSFILSKIKIPAKCYQPKLKEIFVQFFLKNLKMIISF